MFETYSNRWNSTQRQEHVSKSSNKADCRDYTPVGIHTYLLIPLVLSCVFLRKFQMLAHKFYLYLHYFIKNTLSKLISENCILLWYGSLCCDWQNFRQSKMHLHCEAQHPRPYSNSFFFFEYLQVLISKDLCCFSYKMSYISSILIHILRPVRYLPFAFRLIIARYHQIRA